jgi:sigma-B regulation protein RsbU (phosphoserine phosphatase)
MKILIAEDDSMGNILLKRYLVKWGFEVVTAFDGAGAWRSSRGKTLPG